MQATRNCSLPECDRPHKGRGLCDLHIQRERRTGTTASPVKTLAERFWAKVDQRGPDDCWLWTAAVNERGYGVMRPTGQRSGPTVKAHRVSAQLAGMVIDGLMVRHHCDNPPCVNPQHLEPGEQIVNVADMVSRGRQSRGSSRPLARLSEGDIPVIFARLQRGDLQREIAVDYGVARSSISRIKTGRHWNAVTPPAARDLIGAVVEALAGTA